MNGILDDRHDVFSLAGDGRQVLVTYPPNLSLEEAELVCQWLFLVGAKLKRQGASLDQIHHAFDRIMAKLDERRVEIEAELKQIEEARTAGDIEALQRLDPATALQRQLLAKRAGASGATTAKPAVPPPWVPPAGGTTPAVPEPRPDPDAEPPAAMPSAGGAPKEHHKTAACRAKRTEVAKLIASSDGPQRPIDICRRLDIPDGSIRKLLDCDWFAKTAAGKFAPCALTDAGRQALRDAGFILPPADESATPAPETSPPEPAANPGVPEPAGLVAEPPPETSPPPAPPPAVQQRHPPRDKPFASGPAEKAKRAAAHAALIAETLADSTTPMTVEGIAKESGLPPEAVTKRLERHGPSAFTFGQVRYYLKSGDLWSLTDAGRELARHAAGDVA